MRTTKAKSYTINFCVQITESIARVMTKNDDEETHILYHHTHPPGYGG